MDGVIVGFISVGLIATVNLAISAFNYGRLSQSVVDLTRRMSDQEKKVDSLEIDTPPCQFHIDLDKKVVELKGRMDAYLKQG